MSPYAILNPAVLLRALRRFLNSLLPFTDPATPLAQDLTHAVALCALFYLVPRWWERRRGGLRAGAGGNGGERLATRQREEPLREQQHEAAGIDVDGRGGAWGDEGEAQHEQGDLLDGFDEDAEIWEDNPEELFELDGEEGEAQFGDEGQHGEDPLAAEGAAGPADPDFQHQQQNPPRAQRQQRTNIGPKKAKSIARRDQRRAYHEFHRQEAELRRQREAEGAEEREEALLEEKRRRAVVEMEVEERQRKEREQRRAKEEAEREREMARREEVITRVRSGLAQRGFVDLEALGLGELEWMKGLVRASGLLLATSGDEMRMMTETGWVVNVDRAVMDEVYARATRTEKGTVSMDELAGMVEGVVRERAEL